MSINSVNQTSIYARTSQLQAQRQGSADSEVGSAEQAADASDGTVTQGTPSTVRRGAEKVVAGYTSKLAASPLSPKIIAKIQAAHLSPISGQSDGVIGEVVGDETGAAPGGAAVGDDATATSNSDSSSNPDQLRIRQLQARLQNVLELIGEGSSSASGRQKNEADTLFGADSKTGITQTVA